MARQKSKSSSAAIKKSKPKKSPTSRFRVRREGDTVIVSVPVKFYRRNGRQMVLANKSIEEEQETSNESRSAESTLVSSTLITAIAKAYQWQEQFESGGFETIEDLADSKQSSLSSDARINGLFFCSPSGPIEQSVAKGSNFKKITN